MCHCFVYLTHVSHIELFALGLFVLCYVLIIHFMFYYSSYVSSNCFVCFSLYFVCSVFLYSFVFFFSLCIELFLFYLCIAYGPLPPGENPIAVNKYHITSYHTISYVTLFLNPLKPSGNFTYDQV
jgi:hypothetical protein